MAAAARQSDYLNNPSPASTESAEWRRLVFSCSVSVCCVYSVYLLCVFCVKAAVSAVTAAAVVPVSGSGVHRSVMCDTGAGMAHCAIPVCDRSV